MYEDKFLRNFLIVFGIIIAFIIVGGFFLIRSVDRENHQEQRDCASMGGTWHDGGKYAQNFCVSSDGRIIKFY